MKYGFFYIILFLSVFQSCLNEPEMTSGIVNLRAEPTVVTGLCNFPEDGTLEFEGAIMAEGRFEVTQKGICWSLTSTEPDETDNVLFSPEISENFAVKISTAIGDTTYYWRAFAKNLAGIAYGTTKKIRTPVIWDEKDSFRSYTRLRFTSFYIGGKFYITCGDNYLINFRDLWEYDLRQNKWWGTNPDFPGTARRYLVSFTIGDSAYVGTGQSAAYTLYDDFYIFNGKTKEWQTTVIHSGIGERYLAGAFSYDNCGYIVGGQELTQMMNDVWRYKISNGTGAWEKMNNFPVPIIGGICMFNEKRVFVGFGDNSESVGKIWEYHPMSDSWTEFTTLPSALNSVFISGAILENKEQNTDYLYFVNGDNNIWELNLNTKAWKQKQDLPEVFLYEDGSGGNQIMMTAASGSSIYIGLGYQPYFYEYHPFWDN
jgi:hypothetical protein